MILTKTFGEELTELAKKYRNLVVLSSDCREMAGIDRFDESFGERHFNFGLAEANMVSSSVGFIIRGKVPFVVGVVNSSVYRPWSQIRSDICNANLNVKIVGINAGLSAGQEGASYQSLEDIALMRSLPNMKVVCPADHFELEAILTAMMEDYGPCYLRLPEGDFGNVYQSRPEFKFGKAQVLRPSKDLMIFATGVMVAAALEVAQRLEQEGVETGVVNVACIKPLDKELVRRLAGETKAIVTLEDHSVVGGLGDAVGEVLVGQNVKFKKLGVVDTFGQSGDVGNLYRHYQLDGDGVMAQVKAFL